MVQWQAKELKNALLIVLFGYISFHVSTMKLNRKASFVKTEQHLSPEDVARGSSEDVKWGEKGRLGKVKMATRTNEIRAQHKSLANATCKGLAFAIDWAVSLKATHNIQRIKSNILCPTCMQSVSSTLCTFSPHNLILLCVQKVKVCAGSQQDLGE